MNNDEKLKNLRRKLLESNELIDKNNYVAALKIINEIYHKSLKYSDNNEILNLSIHFKEKIERKVRLRKNFILIITIIFLLTSISAVLLFSDKRNILIDFEVQTEMVKLKYDGDLLFSDFPTERVDINSFQKIHFYALLKETENENSSKFKEEEKIVIRQNSAPSSFSIIGDNIYIDRISTPESCTIKYLKSNKTNALIQLKTHSGNIKGEIQTSDWIKAQCINGDSNIYVCDGNYLKLKPTESIIFKGSNNIIIKVFLKKNRTNFGKQYTNIRKISFNDLDNEFDVSGVLSGVINFHNISKSNYEIKRNDYIVINPTEYLKLIYMDFGDKIKLRLKGKVFNLKVNGTSLLPSKLEWIYKNNSIIIYFASVTSLFSLVWAFFERIRLIRD